VSVNRGVRTSIVGNHGVPHYRNTRA